ncbi:hypothetical protein [Aureimonas flava]|uniref:hypothetical protein n=1 Tax=Aureimonas flava TaxID=2320271 RepID=UPI0010A9697D|nr:hypothetical protein [Aureimonas flava]
MIASFDELTSRCTNDSSKSHIAEAIKCYESGAYRAAIVTTYIAVCFDLIEKLRSLSAIGDKEAGEEIKKLENRQDALEKGQTEALRKLLDFERGLLETFRDKFGFFGKSEFEEMNRLRSDRHRCAHPTYLNSSLPYAPNAELARLHIVNALNLVLTQPPRHGKAAVDAVGAVILSTYFPETIKDAVSRLSGTELKNARPALIRSIVDTLMFGWPDKASGFYKKNSVVRSVLAILEMDRREAAPRVLANCIKLLRRTEKDSIRFAAAILVRSLDIGEKVPPEDHSTLKALIQDEKLVERPNLLNKALLVSYLKTEARLEVSKLSAEELGNLISDPAREVVERAVTLFASSRSWASTNSYSSLFMVKFSQFITAEDLEKIAKSADDGVSDLIGSGGYTDFIAACYAAKKIPSTEISAILSRNNLEQYVVEHPADEGLN